MASELAVIGLDLLAALLAAFAQYLFKKHLKPFGISAREFISAVLERHMLAGIVLYGISFLLYIYALYSAPIVSFVYPIFASTFIFVFVISKLAFNEPIGKARLAGMLLIVLGISVIAFTF